MEQKTKIETLHRFTQNKYSWSDYLQIKNWFSDNSEFETLKTHWDGEFSNFEETSFSENESKLDSLFEKIHYKILLNEQLKPHKSTFMEKYQRVAAVLLIPILAGFLAWFLLSPKNGVPPTAWAEIYAPAGARTSFILPDGSRGWLNNGSHLKYPVAFDKKRKVELTGEACFEIKKVPGSTFTVSIPDMDIKVLGTVFNVSTYPGDKFKEVVLQEGVVEIEGETGAFKQLLKPGEKFTYDRELGTITIKNVDPEVYTAWKDGYLVLDNEPLGEAVGKIERWYNTEIILNDDQLKRYRFRATFKDEPLEEVLRLMAITTPIKYNIEKREANKDGIYQKRKVIIKLK